MLNNIDQKNCWPEPNAKYLHERCIECKKPFLGPKRESVCYGCYTEKEAYKRAQMEPNEILQDLTFTAADGDKHTYQPSNTLYSVVVDTPFGRLIAPVSREVFEKIGDKPIEGSDLIPFCTMRNCEAEDKFVSPCPPPTAHQNELLDILIEECAEVIQRATKMKRFGVEEKQTGQDFTNRERLSHELGDLFAVYDRCRKAGLLDDDAIAEQIPIKFAKLDKYLQTEPEQAA